MEGPFWCLEEIQVLKEYGRKVLPEAGGIMGVLLGDSPPYSWACIGNHRALRNFWGAPVCFNHSVAREGRDLGVAFKAPPGSQASSRGEAKDSALLSSRDAGLLEPPERPQGHAGEKRGVAGLLLGRTERAARAAELQLCAQAR